MRATVVQSTCQSEKCKKLAASTLLEVEMSKKCTALWRDAQFEVKTVKAHKAHHCRNTFGSWDVETVRGLVARSAFPSQNGKTQHARTTFGHSSVLFLKAGAMDSAPREKWPKRMGLVAFETDGSAWDIWRMSAKMHFAWQAQYKGHLHQTC